MTEGGDVYYGTVATLYDLWLDTVDLGDEQFFQDAINQFGEPALELACGTGRLLLKYIERGMGVEGLDASAEMLDICRTKALARGVKATLHHQSMRAMELPRKFRTVFCAAGSFTLLSDESDARAALTRIYDHLETDGRVVIALYVPWQNRHPTGPDPANEWYVRREAVRPEDGATARCSVRESHDPVGQLHHAHGHNEVILDRRVVQTESFSLICRWWEPWQFVNLVTNAGFIDARVLDGYTNQRADDDATLFPVVGTRPNFSG